MKGYGYTPLVSKAFYQMKKTRGIYGLRDPRTGAVRYIGSSEHIERRYWHHVEKVARDNSGGPWKRAWMMELRRAGLKPDLLILQEIADGNLRDAECAFIADYELVGWADLNINFTSKVQKTTNMHLRRG